MAVQTKMTAAEFLELPETSQRTELIDGEIIVAPAPRDSHQDTVFEAAKYVERIAPQGKVRLSPVDVYLDESNVVQPDVIWNSHNSPCILIADSYWQGAPDLVVEVLSPSTALRDKRTKFQLYEKYGVREYWIVDAIAHYVEVWLHVEGKFSLHGVFGTGETFVSKVLGEKQVEVSSIFGT